MKFSLAVAISAFLMIGEALFAPNSFGQTQTSSTGQTQVASPTLDFAAAVQAGLQSLAANAAAQSQQQEIQNQDYKSAWDEFGINALVDGSVPQAEISNQVTQDIVQSVDAAQNYNQQEADYLQTNQITPEQVQNAEHSVGVDVSPNEPINPNPSVDLNSDVNISPADEPLEDNAGIVPQSETGTGNGSLSTGGTEVGTTGNGTSAQDANAPAQSAAGPAQGASNSAPDANAPPTGTSAAANENTIFNAILQSEQDHPVDQTPPPSDTSSAPPADDSSAP